MQKCANEIERRFAAMHSKVERSFAGMGNRICSSLDGALRSTVALSGTAIGVNEIVKYADAWTEAGNKIGAAATSAGVEAGLRSALCIAGHHWTASDIESAGLIAAAFQKLAKGARPSWAEGQPEYTAPVEACNWCKAPLDQFQIDRRERFCGATCATAALEYRSYATHFNEDTMGRAAYRIILQEKTYPRGCAQCGATYHPIRDGSEQRFCSSKCRDASMTTLLNKPCLACGKDFKPHDRASAFCSPSCSATYRFQSARIEKECACCQRGFVAKISTALYCSNAFKKRAFKGRKQSPVEEYWCDELGLIDNPAGGCRRNPVAAHQRCIRRMVSSGRIATITFDSLWAWEMRAAYCGWTP